MNSIYTTSRDLIIKDEPISAFIEVYFEQIDLSADDLDLPDWEREELEERLKAGLAMRARIIVRASARGVSVEESIEPVWITTHLRAHNYANAVIDKACERLAEALDGGAQ